MIRTFSRSEKLVIASHNPGKVSEIRALLTPLRIEVIGADELGLIEPEETGKTFTENAELRRDLLRKHLVCLRLQMIPAWNYQLLAEHLVFIQRVEQVPKKISVRLSSGSMMPY
jgi:hypothetical protein